MSSEVVRQRYLEAMSRVAHSVHVVTSHGPAGWAGLTATALTSVSADGPHPTLLVCLNAARPSTNIIEQNGVFCVNTLHAEQSYIADAFAGRFRSAERDRFATGEWSAAPSGCPQLVDPLVAFDCRVQSFETVGSHLVILGDVENIHIGRGGAGLLYVNRGYHAPARLDIHPRLGATAPSASTTSDATQAKQAGWIRRTLLGGARRQAAS